MIRIRRVQLPFPRLLWRIFFVLVSMFTLSSWLILCYDFYVHGLYQLQLAMLTVAIVCVILMVTFTKDKSKIW